MNKTLCRGLCLPLLLIFLLSVCGCSSDAPEILRPSEGEGVVTIAAAGDIFLTDEMLSDALQPNGSFDFDTQFGGAMSAIAAADIAIGNLEGNFVTEGYSESKFPVNFAQTLSNIGFDILQTSNSRTIDNGLSGMAYTRSVAESNGMRTLGTYANEEEREDSPALIYDINGVRIAFIAFTKGFGGLSLPGGAGYVTNLLYSDYTTNYEEINTSAITDAVEEALACQPDILIAGLHWGSEGTEGSSRSQETIADLLFRSGVDIILGSHSHLAGTVEERHLKLDDGSRKDVLLAYALGDFCAAEEGYIKLAPVLNITITRNHASGDTKITDYGFTAIAAVDNGRNEPDRYSILDADNAIALYENTYYLRIDEELYEKLITKRENLAEDLGLN
ncbi:MAG: CapA family protein [Oscillospiraceae bacterium]|nr:CapA family protein [Oscillospiraceae bacterium]